MPAPLKTKEEVLSILLETFRADGYDGASLATLSEATGLGKSSLYHYFPGGKEDMIHQVLDQVDAWVLAEIVEPLGRPGPPARRLDHMLDVISRFYDHGSLACILGRLCASVDRDRFHERVERLFRGWIDALSRLIAESGVPRAVARRRAEDALVRIQGALVLCEGLGEQGPFKRMVRQLKEELLAPE
jgi:TetR/AcrR family transcriptional regulator, lmrAB and yxaGH operons repressor